MVWKEKIDSRELCLDNYTGSMARVYPLHIK